MVLGMPKHCAVAVRMSKQYAYRCGRLDKSHKAIAEPVLALTHRLLAGARIRSQCATVTWATCARHSPRRTLTSGRVMVQAHRATKAKALPTLASSVLARSTLDDARRPESARAYYYSRN